LGDVHQVDKWGVATTKNSIVKLLSDEGKDNEQGEGEILGGNGNCVNITPKEIMQYVEFTEKLLLEMEE
jgi:hypothetical protein